MVPGTQHSRFRLADGWWVALATGVVCLLLLTWALAPAMFRMFNRPPGDGLTVASYAFDLSNASVDPWLIRTPMLHRDMVPVMDEPRILSAADVEKLNSARATRYLVSDDLVIGVEYQGVARAYPLSVLHVHELVHDMLGDTPVLVTWHWPSGVARVLVRTDPLQRWGVSGLAAGGNGLIYERRGEPGGEALYSQWLASAVTGPEAGTRIPTIPHQVRRWADWKHSHPETSVLGPDLDLKKRYKKSDPSTYYRNGKMLFDHPVPESGPPAKTWVTMTETDEGTMIRSWPQLQADAVDGIYRDGPLVYELTRDPDTVVVLDAATGTPLDARHVLWFTLHALEPDQQLP